MGTGPNGAALVTAEDLAGISAASLYYASVDFPIHYYDTEQNLPHVTQTDASLARSPWNQMAVRVGHNDAGQVSYDLTYWEGDVNVFEFPTPTYRWRFHSEAAGTNVRRVSSGGRQGALFRREDSSGNLWAAIATDISGPGDTDWLATGVWAHRGDSSWTGRGTDSSRGYRFGVFATGGDPYGRVSRTDREDPDYAARASLITALTGTATYEGDASGVYSRRTGATEATRRNDFFSADATLTIDFSVKQTYGGEGAAAGRIHDMKIGGTPISGNPEIALIGGFVGKDGGIMAPVDGAASMTFNGESWEGYWGAGLFGSPASGATGADRLPGSVAGTFGASPGGYYSREQGNGDHIVGAFGAHRTGWTDAPEGVRQDAP